MYAAFILRIGSLVLSAVMGGMAIFCLFCAGQVANPDVVLNLLATTILFGGLATAVVHCQNRWLD
jgi:hypothetical protein